MEIKQVTINYQYDQNGRQSSSTNFSTEKAVPNQKTPETYDTHQPGDFD